MCFSLSHRHDFTHKWMSLSEFMYGSPLPSCLDGLPNSLLKHNFPWWLDALVTFINLVFSWGVVPSFTFSCSTGNVRSAKRGPADGPSDTTVEHRANVSWRPLTITNRKPWRKPFEDETVLGWRRFGQKFHQISMKVCSIVVVSQIVSLDKSVSVRDSTNTSSVFDVYVNDTQKSVVLSQQPRDCLWRVSPCLSSVSPQFHRPEVWSLLESVSRLRVTSLRTPLVKENSVFCFLWGTKWKPRRSAVLALGLFWSPSFPWGRWVLSRSAAMPERLCMLCGNLKVSTLVPFLHSWFPRHLVDLNVPPTPRSTPHGAVQTPSQILSGRDWLAEPYLTNLNWPNLAKHVWPNLFSFLGGERRREARHKFWCAWPPGWVGPKFRTFSSPTANFVLSSIPPPLSLSVRLLVELWPVHGRGRPKLRVWCSLQAAAQTLDPRPFPRTLSPNSADLPPTAQVSRFFCPSRPTFRLFFLSRIFSWNSGHGLQPWTTQIVRLGFSEVILQAVRVSQNDLRRAKFWAGPGEGVRPGRGPKKPHKLGEPQRKTPKGLYIREGQDWILRRSTGLSRAPKFVWAWTGLSWPQPDEFCLQLVNSTEYLGVFFLVPPSWFHSHMNVLFRVCARVSSSFMCIFIHSRVWLSWSLVRTSYFYCTLRLLFSVTALRSGSKYTVLRTKDFFLDERILQSVIGSVTESKKRGVSSRDYSILLKLERVISCDTLYCPYDASLLHTAFMYMLLTS